LKTISSFLNFPSIHKSVDPLIVRRTERELQQPMRTSVSRARWHGARAPLRTPFSRLLRGSHPGVAEHRSLAPAMSFHCVLLSPRGRRAGLARDRARLCVLVLREKKLREPGRESAGLG